MRMVAVAATIVCCHAVGLGAVVPLVPAEGDVQRLKTREGSRGRDPAALAAGWRSIQRVEGA